jgi:threonine dehydrogenase-like Zn-dependent dehydrogenase
MSFRHGRRIDLHDTVLKVQIDVSWGGICGTDLHEYTSGPMTINKPEQPHGITGAHLPVAFGHEFTGRISALPDKYTDEHRGGRTFNIGMPVMIDPRIICRTCPSCTSGANNICSNWGYIGLNGGGGGGAGFSQKCNVEMRMVHILPDDGSVDLNSAVLCQPLTVGRHAMISSGVGIDDWANKNVLVLGGGPVGLAVLLNLRARGLGVGSGCSGKVFVSEPTAKRARMIKQLGLAEDDNILDPRTVDVAERCRAGTAGKGIDVVFDAAGVEAAMLAGMDSLRIRGTYVNIAGWKTPFAVPMQYAFFKELTIKFSLGNDDDNYREVVQDYVAGKFVGAEALITRRLPVERLAKDGLEELVRNKDDHVKIVATWKTDLLKAAASLRNEDRDSSQ